jgi:hypothetical protein
MARTRPQGPDHLREYRFPELLLGRAARLSLERGIPVAARRALNASRLRWSPIFGQVVKLGSPFEGLTHGGQAEALLG